MVLDYIANSKRRVKEFYIGRAYIEDKFTEEFDLKPGIKLKLRVGGENTHGIQMGWW